MDIYNSIQKNKQLETESIDNIDFQNISSCMLSFNYDNAILLIEEQLAKNIYDIRIIIFYLFCNIVKKGIGQLNANIECLYLIIKEHKNTLTPKRNFEIILSKSISWLHKNTNEHIKYLYTEKQLQKNFDYKVYQKLIENYESMFVKEYNFDISAEILKLNEILIELKDDDTVEEQNDKISEEKDSVKDNDDKDVPDYKQNKENDNEKESIEWKKLKRKIDLFRVLIKEKRYLEAALFFKDINNLIISFDPRNYFPEVFFPFYNSMNDEFEKILEIIDKKHKTLQWHITEQLYNTDYEALFKESAPFTDANEEQKELSAFIKQNSKVLDKRDLIEPDFLNSGTNEFLNNSLDKNPKENGDIYEEIEKKSNELNSQNNSDGSNYDGDYRSSNSEKDDFYNKY